MICKGLVALVTGGASGLGKATVTRLVNEGNKVVLCDLPSSIGETVAKELGAENVKFAPADVCSELEVSNVMDITKQAFGKLNVVVNCAGTSCAFKTYNFNKKRAHELDDFVRIMMVNVAGTFNVSRLAAGLIGENAIDDDNQRGVIINTSGFPAYEGQQGQVAFATSKAAVRGMTLPLARDLGTAGIRVVSIAPGIFDTPLQSALPEKVRIFLSRCAISPQRFGKPEEFAHLVQHVIENNFINGVDLKLDAGLKVI